MDRVSQQAAESRFWAKVAKSDGCWLWIGKTNRGGYGQAYDHRGSSKGRHQALAHRMAYELAIGPIPDGLTLDHLCRTRACVRPDHLRPCTIGENLRAPGATTFQARNAAKTRCKRGHELAGENLSVNNRGQRVCLTCYRERKRLYRTRRQSEMAVAQ